MDPVGTALIGLGKVAETHARALASLPQSRFVAVCDPVVARADAFTRTNIDATASTYLLAYDC